MSFASSLRSRPRISVPTSTEAFDSVPLNGAAKTCIVTPLTGSGLFRASRTSALGWLLALAVVATGAFPLGFAYPRRARATVRPGRVTRTSIRWTLPSRLGFGG